MQSGSGSIELVHKLKREVTETVRGLLSEEQIALLDFPNHPNIGDSAIWLAQMKLLEHGLGRRPIYSCAYYNFDSSAASSASSLLLSGGGNLGDLWPRHQRFREEVISSFPNKKIIQLPQSIHFQDRANLERAKRVFGSHPQFTLLVRDQASRQLAESEFGNRVELCPDAAFFLGAITRDQPVSGKILALVRSDKEGEQDRSLFDEEDIHVVDWIQRHTTARLTETYSKIRQLGNSILIASGNVAPFASLRTASFQGAAEREVKRGIELLTGFDVVITDRLHGHIMCLLLNVPHVLLNDRYRKVRNFHQTWTSESEITHVAADAREAIALARSLLASQRD